MDDNAVQAHVSADMLLGNLILGQLNGLQLSALLPHITQRHLSEGEALYRAGDAADTLFVILRGSLQLDGPDGQKTLQFSGHTGEESVLGMATHMGGAHAAGATHVLVIPAASLTEITNQHPPLRAQFFQSFAGRFGVKVPPVDPPATPLLGDEGLMSVLGWLMAIALPIAVYLGSSAYGLDPAAADFLAIVSVTVCMWLFALVPEYVPPMFAALAVILLDVAPPEIALSGFQSQSFFMCLSVFGLGALLVTSGVTYRFSLWVLSHVPASPFGYNLSLFSISAVLSPIIPSVLGRVVIVSPFLINLIELSGAGKKDLFANRMIYSLTCGASLLVPLFLTASVPNLMVYGLFDAQTQFAFDWVSWFYAASVFGLIMLVCFTLVSSIIFRGARHFSIPRQTIIEQRRLLGPVSSAEWAAVLSVLAMIIGILTEALHQVDVPWIALSIFVALMLTSNLGRDTIRANIDWTILIYIATIVSWVPIAVRTGLDVVIVENLTWLGVYMSEDFPLFIVMVSAMILLVRLALPTGVTVVLFATALFPLAIAQGLSLWLIGFIILAIADTFIFPYQSSYFLKLKSDLSAKSLGHVCDEKRIITANIVLIVFRIAAIYGCLVFWTHLDLI